MMRCRLPLLAAALVIAVPVVAQDDTTSYRPPAPAPTPQPQTQSGDVARSSAGRAGQRQVRDELARKIGNEPMGRIDTRIRNRVQSRLRTRIDPYYDPQTTAAAPFIVADEETRTPRRP